MTILRAALLEFLVCFHVIGGAVLFRRWFPRESPWFGFFVPMLVFVGALNFVEHFIALPGLGWLLPLTMGAGFWALLDPRGAWEGLRLPSILFVTAFTYVLVIRGLHPEIPYWTEGINDLARILDFCLGETLPPTDSWLPPYDHGGYYTFQHYAASVLKRLLMVDVGTSYNVGYVLLDAFICLLAAAVGQALSGRNWIAVANFALVAAGFAGSAVIMTLFGPAGFDPLLALDMHHGWADPHHNPLWKWLAADPYQTPTRLFVPGDGIYLSEFHATFGGHFLTLLAVLSAVEAGRDARANVPWVLLLVLPFLTIVTATWYLPVVAVFCAVGLTVAWMTGRRPENPRAVAVAAAAGITVLWPVIARLTFDPDPQAFRLTATAEHTWPWLFAEQWWPVYVPWLLVLPVWRTISPPARALHVSLFVLLAGFEVFTIGDRELTLEKIWSALFGAGLVVLWPLVFRQRAWPFRLATVLVLAAAAVSFRGWWGNLAEGVARGDDFFRLQGDRIMQDDPTKRRLLQVAGRLQGATILSGKSAWGYNLSLAVAEFTGNRSFVGWTYPEKQAGHEQEANARAAFSDDFYAGRIADPLPYLAAQGIAAVLVWPDDATPDDLLAHLQKQLAPDFIYIDCKLAGPDNAGLFLQRGEGPADK